MSLLKKVVVRVKANFGTQKKAFLESLFMASELTSQDLTLLVFLFVVISCLSYLSPPINESKSAP